METREVIKLIAKTRQELKEVASLTTDVASKLKICQLRENYLKMATAVAIDDVLRWDRSELKRITESHSKVELVSWSRYREDAKTLVENEWDSVDEIIDIICTKIKALEDAEAAEVVAEAKAKVVLPGGETPETEEEDK